MGGQSVSVKSKVILELKSSGQRPVRDDSGLSVLLYGITDDTA